MLKSLQDAALIVPLLSKFRFGRTTLPISPLFATAYVISTMGCLGKLAAETMPWLMQEPILHLKYLMLEVIII